MTRALKRARAWSAAGIMLAASALAGCGGGFDGVEVNSKLLDSVGLGGNPFAKKEEPKTAVRAPLVVPPDTTRLPEPGSVPTVETASIDPAWPKDREGNKAAEAAARQKAQEKACSDGNWKERAVDPNADKVGPEGRCNGTLFSFIGDSLFGNGEKK